MARLHRLQMIAGSGFKGIHRLLVNSSPSAPISVFRKSVHSSVYDKNEDEGITPHLVPDHVIGVDSQKTWVPHPVNGVFVPQEEAKAQVFVAQDKAAESVLEQQVWFRPLEDVQKQPYN